MVPSYYSLHKQCTFMLGVHFLFNKFRLLTIDFFSWKNNSKNHGVQNLRQKTEGSLITDTTYQLCALSMFPGRSAVRGKRCFARLLQGRFGQESRVRIVTADQKARKK